MVLDKLLGNSSFEAQMTISSMLATAFDLFRFFPFPYILAKGETLPLLREGQLLVFLCFQFR